MWNYVVAFLVKRDCAFSEKLTYVATSAESRSAPPPATTLKALHIVAQGTPRRGVPWVNPPCESSAARVAPIPRRTNAAESDSAQIRPRLCLRPDGLLRDDFNLHRGYWEAKDSADKLADEIKKEEAASQKVSAARRWVALWSKGSALRTVQTRRRAQAPRPTCQDLGRTVSP
jgi:hypothetical protein